MPRLQASHCRRQGLRQSQSNAKVMACHLVLEEGPQAVAPGTPQPLWLAAPSQSGQVPAPANAPVDVGTQVIQGIGLVSACSQHAFEAFLRSSMGSHKRSADREQLQACRAMSVPN